jgi:hypothetical protein
MFADTQNFFKVLLLSIIVNSEHSAHYVKHL